MNKEKVKLIVKNIKQLVNVLETEINSDTNAYKFENYNQMNPILGDYDELYDEDDE
tara:strand:- start:364 stop:531 length:168 start_codon:yes stop_codon:yes gene_type:complete